MPKRSIFLLPLLAFPAVAAAEDYCTAQTQALLARIESEVSPAPTDAQLEQMRAIARSMCEDKAVQNVAPPPPEGYATWFTYLMLNKQPDKPGNKRLRSLK